MVRPESHRIDERAKRVFEGSLPDSWVPREQHPDYRIDYTIEIFEGDRPTGLFWNVQLKGTKKPRRLKARSAMSYSMEVEHLAYYLDNVAIPVFLVLVDTTRHEGWWVFLQHYIGRELRLGWRSKSTATIRIPSSNSILDWAKLQGAVSAATKYMRELHPSSIAASVAAEKNRMESLDPRFEVDINATGDRTHYHLKPKEEAVSFNLHFKGDDAVAKAKELVEAGGMVDLLIGEAEIDGMVEGWRDGYDLVAVETTKRAPALIRFSALDEVKNQRAFFDVSGEFTSGTKRGRLMCKLPGGLMRVVLEIDSENTRAPIDIEFDLSKWVGMDIRVLPHLDTIAPFFELVGKDQFKKGDSFIEMEVFILGNRMFDSTGDIVLNAQMQCYSSLVVALRDAREVARELGVAAMVPADMQAKHIHEIDVVFGLLKHGVHTFPTPNATIPLIVDRREYEEQIADLRVKGSEISVFQGGSLPFLSTAVDIGFQNVVFSAMTIDESRTIELGIRSREVVFVADENCVCTLRQCTDSETQKLAHLRSPEQRGDTP